MGPDRLPTERFSARELVLLLGALRTVFAQKLKEGNFIEKDEYQELMTYTRHEWVRVERLERKAGGFGDFT
jgi:hypothetical protein